MYTNYFPTPEQIDKIIGLSAVLIILLLAGGSLPKRSQEHGSLRQV